MPIGDKEPMLQRTIRHLRSHIVAYIALAVAIGGGGGYALAATSNKTITVCAENHTGLLHLHHSGRCPRGQTRISWNQRGPQGVAGRTGAQGPQGVQGPPGPAGPTGAPASAWGVVDNAGLSPAAHGLTSQHIGPGTYQITITTPACAQSENVPTVTLSDAYPPIGHTSGNAFPVAWIGNSIENQQFTVYTGVFDSGTFALSDHTFNVQDVC